MKKVARYISVGATTAIVGAIGLTSMASAYSIYGTGPFSNNGIYSNGWNSYWRNNYNNIGVNNYNNQNAYTGNAYVGWNTFGGGAYTGDATNWNNTSTDINLWNY